MEKNSGTDIDTFPELFDGLEHFSERQAAGLKRACFHLALCTAAGGGLLAYLLKTFF